MKTISEYLKELQEPYKTQALNNTSEEDKNVKAKSLEEALEMAFVWSNTIEGLDYWRQLYYKDSYISGL